MKGTRKSMHTRTSKRGRKFYAGRGIKRKKVRRASITNWDEYYYKPSISKQMKNMRGWAKAGAHRETPEEVAEAFRQTMSGKKNFSMGYFENPEEKEKIEKKIWNRILENARITGEGNIDYRTKDPQTWNRWGRMAGYEEALKDLGLPIGDNAKLPPRYGRPERRRQ